MAEDVKILNVAIRPGMRQDLDSIDAPPGSLEIARNVRFPVARGAAVPRPGTVGIPADTVTAVTPIANQTEDMGAVFSVGDAPAVAVGGAVYAYDAAAEKFGIQGSYSTAQPVRRRTAVSPAASGFGDARWGIAVNTTGHVCYVAVSNGLAAVITIETAEGIRQFTTRLSSVSGARIVACGTAFVIVLQSSLSLVTYTLTVSSGAWSLAGPTTVATLNDIANNWDVCAESATMFYVYFQNAAAQATARRLSYPALSATDYTHTVTGMPVYSVYSDATNVWLGYNDDPSVTNASVVRVLNASTVGFIDDLTLSTGDTAIGVPLIGPGRAGAIGTAFCVRRYTRATAPYSVGTMTDDLVLTGSTLSSALAAYTSWHYAPAAKPEAGGRVWVQSIGNLAWTPAAPLGWRFARYLLVRYTNATIGEPPVIELATDERESQELIEVPMFVSAARGTSSSFVLLAENFRAGASARYLLLYEYTFSSQEPLREVAPIGRSAVISGQPVQLWARGAAQTANASVAQRSAVTIGYAARPVIAAATASNAAGDLAVNSTYSWVALYEWVDPASGNLHVSAPSAPYTTNTGSNTQVEFTITGCPADQRAGDSLSPIRPIVHMFRTRANESQLRRETFESPELAIGETATLTSNLPDADLDDFLYTEGGVAEFSLAPSARFIRREETGIWFGGLWNPRMIQRSRDFFPDEPVQASDLDSWKVYLPDDVVGMGCQDGQRYCFCENGIYVVAGDSPDEKGVGTFAPPRALTNEFGAIESTSILETSIGIFFRSTRGFMLIPRGGGNPVFIGAGIQSDIRAGSYDECLGAATVSGDTRTARFLMRAGSSTRVYVYDFDSQSWSYDDHGVEMAACGNWPDGFCTGLATLSGDYAAYQESSAEFADGSGETGITSYVRLHGVRPFGIAGWGRCQTAMAVMSEPVADATGVPVTLIATTDRKAIHNRPWTVTADGSGATLYRALDCQHQQCTEIMVEWSTARTAAANALGPELNAVTLALTPEKGSRLLDQVNR